MTLSLNLFNVVINEDRPKIDISAKLKIRDPLTMDSFVVGKMFCSALYQTVRRSQVISTHLPLVGTLMQNFLIGKWG